MVSMATLMVVLGLIGCGGDAPAPKEASQAEAPSKTLPTQIDPNAAAETERFALVPTPLETQKGIQKAGITQALHEVTPEWNFHFDKKEANRVAVRTGVQLADLVLDATSATTEDLVLRLGQVREGMKTLEAGKKIDETLGDLIDRVKAGALDRDTLVKELDELAGIGIRELEFQGADAVVPLIQAGVWLEGVYVVAEAVKRAGKPEAADTVFKQPKVVDYFIGYAHATGLPGVDEDTAKVLHDGLTKLKVVSIKQGSYQMGDIDLAIEATDAILTEL